MAIAYQSSASIAAAVGSSVQVSKPSGVVDGDLLIAVIGWNDGTTEGTLNSVPSGWNLLLSTTPASDTNITTYYKIASSEPSNWTWGFSNADIASSGGVLRIDGHSLITPVYASLGGDATSSGSPSYITGITPSVANSLLLIATFSTSNGDSNHSGHAITTSNPTWAEAFDVRGTGITSDITLSVAYATRPETTSTGAWTVTVGGGSTESASHIIAIAPRVDVTVALDVASLTATAQDPTVTGGATVTLDSASMTATPQTITATAAAPKWVNQDKSANATIVNQDKTP